MIVYGFSLGCLAGSGERKPHVVRPHGMDDGDERLVLGGDRQTFERMGVDAGGPMSLLLVGVAMEVCGDRPYDVSRGHETDKLPVANNWELPKIMLEHESQRMGDAGIDRGGEDFRGHHLFYLEVLAMVCEIYLVEKIPFSKYSLHSSIRGDHNRIDMMVHHELKRFADIGFF